MYTDPIADMLTRIRNAARVHKREVLIPFSKIKFMIGQILEREGYVVSVEKVEDGVRPMLRVCLKYDGKFSRINAIDRVSKPGHRKYAQKDALPIVRNHLGIAIISTSRGMMTNKEAKKQGVGGEVICTIY